MKKHYITYAIAVLLFLQACASAYEQPSLTQKNNAYGTTKFEQELFEESDVFRRKMEEYGQIKHNGSTVDYVREIGNKLLSDEIHADITFNFYVTRDPIPNAYALPNGDIYVTTGLLSRYNTERQLAFVLAHEIAHVLERHSLESSKANQHKQIAAIIGEAALIATTGLNMGLAQLAAAASMVSHSRDNEAEADTKALEIIAKHNYNLNDIPSFFTPLKLSKKQTPPSAFKTIWSTHPDHSARIASLEEKIASNNIPTNTSGIIGKAKYSKIRQASVEESIKLLIQNQWYELAQDLIDEEKGVNPNLAMLEYYRGEAQRKSAENPKAAAKEHAFLYDKKLTDTLKEEFEDKKEDMLDQALRSYKKSTKNNPSYAKAYRGLGLTYYAQGRNRLAAFNLKRYLQKGGSKVFDKRYITKLMEKLNHENQSS